MGIRQIDLLQGTLDLLILKSLSTGANHGYGIATRIHDLSEDVLKIEEGSLYPALYRMEEQGLIASEWRTTENNRNAKFYRLTRKGRTAARAARARFGDVRRLKERGHDVRTARLVEDLTRDVRHMMRGLRRSPGFTI